MSSADSYYFRCRTIGRAASPPTWACYEQIPYEDDYSDSESDSCSEDDEDYPRDDVQHEPPIHSEDKCQNGTSVNISSDDPSHDMNMDIEEEGDRNNCSEAHKDAKGKQRALEKEAEKSPRRRRKRDSPVYTLRPILTIQKSQGFVWNQDLFVPPYIKDRYVASTSPPNSKEFISTSVSSTNSALTDYEVEVVEIRVNDGDLDGIMP